MPSIKKILIANRGEIAVRVIRTAKRLGIKTVAVYSDADKDSLYVRLADEAFWIGPPEPRLSYLDQDKILQACEETKADAVHPGYGFLSENAEFAEKLKSKGIHFLGPKPDSIRAMGDKIGSRLLVAKFGVPVVPGYEGNDQSMEKFQSEAKKIGFPIMAKASAGGGGKGMRRVDSFEELESSILSAKREALSAFGDDRILLEKYILNPRHVEFQVFGDQHGNVIHLHERDCSLQRRHQKVVEETPAPRFSKELKAKMAEAAVQAAKSVQYEGAGTVEFILGESGEFYFLEMNTRLQVEHPVTEMTTGLDLVELQIRVAEGEKLPSAPEQKGHAIEVRIYAEDPSNHFLPSIGKIHSARFPEGEGIRVDSGIVSGSEISLYYDPMIAKLIVWAPTRSEAIDKMVEALKNTIVFGPITNTGFLRNLVDAEGFREGLVSTHFIAGNEKELLHQNISAEEKLSFAAFASSLKTVSDPWKEASV
ncbi:acetyl-CoA carboxylase biotin carboxylase subunit [Leptospira idonii]|uniref:Acetyl-CoA carboxylase biotin carboxylase subunit n=1 Tax=Leptospira idonii TaxID=1193500 RepID=A0A4R9LYN5_9LEPT|nr:acetyl-CoA carboxylase biotin carboxylase subunit [Leptospira idonii]TGN19430.1 acetyl-CoA carboxylase biotin carboxylase subunit [Leptospira idonii]